MNSDILIGLAIIPGLAATALILWFLYSVASWAWAELHTSMIKKIKLRPNLAEFKIFVEEDEEDERPEFSEAAEKLVLAFQKSPVFHVVNGLGWTIAIARDHKTVKDES